MKRILATIFAFTYLSSSMGATIHLHYCMGKLISWGLINHESKNCQTCGMEKKSSAAAKNCCKDEHKVLKTDKDQNSSNLEIHFISVTPDATITRFYEFQSFGVSSLAVKNPTAHAPPLTGEQSLFLLNCNFRI